MKKILFSAALSVALMSGVSAYAQSGVSDNGAQETTPGAAGSMAPAVSGAQTQTDTDTQIETGATSATSETSVLGGFYTDDTASTPMAEAEMEAAFRALAAEDQQAAVAECNNLQALQPAESPGRNDAEFEARAQVCETILGIQI